jgi:hypothetical protein
MGWAMIITAISIDLFEALLDLLIIGAVLSPIISICADLGFWIWFKILGVSFSKNPKNLATMLIQALIGLMPGLDILPELSVGVFVLVKLTQSEDKGGLIGKMTHATAPVMQRKVQYAGYNRQVNNMQRLQPNTPNPNQNRQPLTSANKRPTPQYIKDWEESTKKLNDIQHKQFVEKNYKGGMDKYKQDEAKQIADRNQRDEGQRKFKDSTKRYDNLFSGNNSGGGPPQIAKE